MIKVSPQEKQELIELLQHYFDEELRQELGSFDAEFLLDFISEKMGGHFYNQGLSDALKSVQDRFDDISEGIYLLEKDTTSN